MEALCEELCNIKTFIPKTPTKITVFKFGLLNANTKPVIVA